jgi:DNA-binding CsgD family transcriptional regulator
LDQETDTFTLVELPDLVQEWAELSIPSLVENEASGFCMIYDHGIVFAKVKEGGQIEWENIVALDPKLFKNKEEFENIRRIGESQYLIGLTSGYLVLDDSKLDLIKLRYEVEISSIKNFMNDAEPRIIPMDEAGLFKTNEKNFIFENYVSSHLKYQPVSYSYWLDGDMEQWSDWDEDPLVYFYKLKPGSYTYRIKARIGNQVTENISEYSFRIRKAWYLSNYAIGFYFILFIAFSVLVNYFYKSYYRKRQKTLLEKNQKELHYVKLKSDQDLMKVRNEQLRTEIESKNKELAVTTMSLVKKNEFLIELRDRLRKSEEKGQVNFKNLIKEVNKEIENEESWEMLKGAFENVDKDFIRKIMEKHPELTPNDLKLCTYLRLNLNSKEIASLMNISVRSMETKRYRLRKKMGLEHTTNLVEYILSI